MSMRFCVRRQNLFRSWLSVPVLTSPRRYCLLMFSNSIAVILY